ncbi:MAG: hypothetical protein AAFQ19_14905 [Pseudomonadota bacterium]
MSLETHVLNGTLHHIKWWWGGDAWDYHLFQTDQMCGDCFRKFVTRYKVGRSLRRGRETDALRVIKTKVAQSWPLGLSARWHTADSIITQLQDEQITSKPSASLVSKAIWFLMPKGWTLYDKYAADALAISNHKGSTQKRMRDYFNKLHTMRFGQLADMLRSEIKTERLPDLWPERIIDGSLLSKGNMIDRIGPDDACHVLGNRHGNELKEVSQRIVRVIKDFLQWHEVLKT